MKENTKSSSVKTEILTMNKNEPKSSSALDLYCKTSFLDESSDFVECEFKSNGSQKSETLLCEICRDDITPLGVEDRGIHVNKCIDKQISSTSDVASAQSGNVFILGCPLCFRQFSAPELQSSHIKKCGKSKGLSTQSIIQALELQKKYAQERISLGLPVKPVKPHRVNTNKKTTFEPKSKAQSDFQLAKALSLSLVNSTQDGQPHQRPAKKKKMGPTPLLILRTEEERRKMLLERMAFIISPMNICADDSSLISEVDILSQQQKRVYNQICKLWDLSSKASEISDYYVSELCDWIKPSDVEVGSKLGHLSQIAGHEILTQLPCNYTFSCTQDKNVQSKTPASVVECLRSLVASSWMSDVDVHTSCGTVVPAHRLLLAARCPPLKQDSSFCCGCDRAVLKWERTSFDAALQFLNFIYTGNIEVTEETLQDLWYLANKYEVLDLQAILQANDPRHILSDRSIDESSHSMPSQRGTSNATSDSKGESYMNLDIVCNFVDTSLKLSEQPDSEPVDLEQAAFFKYDCQKIKTPCERNPFESSVFSPEEERSLSPVILDRSSSENEAEKLLDHKNFDFAVNSQKLLSKTTYLSGKVSDWVPESKDSIQTFDTSCASLSSLRKTPEKVALLSEMGKIVCNSKSNTGLGEINQFQLKVNSNSQFSHLETPHLDFSSADIEHFQYVKDYPRTSNGIQNAEQESFLNENLDFTMSVLLQPSSKKSHLNEKEVDVHSTDSCDSIKFLGTSCASFDNICETPRKVDIENNSSEEAAFWKSREDQVAENYMFKSRTENILSVDDVKEMLLDVDCEDLDIPVNSSKKYQLDGEDLDLSIDDWVKFLKPHSESFNRVPKKFDSPFKIAEIMAGPQLETVSCESSDFNRPANSKFRSATSHSLGFCSGMVKNTQTLNDAVLGKEKISGDNYLKFKLTDSPVTPLPDYKSMVTPEIKQALKKIGVKALPRKKAVAILSHIYNETHPLMNSDTKVTPQKMSKGKKEPKKRKNVSNDVKKVTKKHRGGHSLSTSQESEDSSPENPDWLGCIPEMSFSQFNEDSPTKINKDDLEAIRHYIQSNEDVYNNVLSYKPLNMVEFHQELKKDSIKISIQKLMDFFDEQCITFTCPRKEEYRKKQNARTQRFRKNMIAKLSQQPR